jgi:hypothetical protein
MFLTSKFNYLLFFWQPRYPAHTRETETANSWEEQQQTIWTKKHYETPLHKQGGWVRSHLLHSSLADGQVCCTICQPQQANCAHICWAQTILLIQTGMFWLFFTNFFNIQSDILSTAGDALRSQTKPYPYERFFCYLVKLLDRRWRQTDFIFFENLLGIRNHTCSKISNHVIISTWFF